MAIRVRTTNTTTTLTAAGNVTTGTPTAAEQKASLVDGQTIRVIADGGEWKWNAASTASASAIVKAHDAGGDGRFLRQLGDVISVTEFGAVGGVTDDTASFNAAIQYIRDNYRDHQAGGVAIYIPRPSEGYYTLDSSLDITELNLSSRFALIADPGVVLWSKAAGKAALDFSLSRYIVLENITVFGDIDTPPAFGFLFTYGTDAVAGTGNSLFKNNETRGDFTKAAMYSYAHEECLHLRCRYENGIESATAYAVAVTGRNLLSATSDFVTIKNPGDAGAPSTSVSNNRVLFLGCESRRRSITAWNAFTFKGEGPAILVDDARSFKYEGYALQNGTGNPVVDLRSSGSQQGCSFVGHMEGSGTYPAFEMKPETGISMQDINIELHVANADPIIKFTTGCRKINTLSIKAPLIDTTLWSVDYTGVNTGLMPKIDNLQIIDTSKQGSTNTTGNINFDKIGYATGKIASTFNNLLTNISPSDHRQVFAGTIITPAGMLEIPGYASATIASGVLTITGSNVMVSGEGDAADTLDTVTLAPTLPGTRITLTMRHAITISEAGNIDIVGGTQMDTVAGDAVVFTYDKTNDKWRPVTAPAVSSP